MGVTIELQNLGDAQLCGGITSLIEHAFAEPTRPLASVDCRIARERELGMRVEGPNGFERSYTLAGSSGEHEPDAVRRLILQLIPAGSV